MEQPHFLALYFVEDHAEMLAEDLVNVRRLLELGQRLVDRQRDRVGIIIGFASLGRPRWFACTTRGARRHDEPRYAAGDVLVFGPETRGLPEEVLSMCPEERRVRIPMQSGARSLNLSNAVAIVVYEAWRQLGFRMS